MKYAGIGSRKTPDDTIAIMEDFAYAIASVSLLRSGGADGADTAFAYGATMGGGRKEIYLPWKGFNGLQDGFLTEPSQAAMELAEQYHPGWRYLSRGAKLLIARNGHQVLGKDLDDPVDMIVCWTPNGSLTGKESNSGGTGQALRIAADHPEIQVFNLKLDDHREAILEVIGNAGIWNRS